jgi:hypothetical protein
VLARQPPGHHRGERQVLRDVAREADEAAVDRQPHDALATIDLLSGFAALTEADDVDLVAGIDQGVALPPHARVAGEDGMDDDGHATRIGHLCLTSSQSTSFSASESASRSTPRSTARASTLR